MTQTRPDRDSRSANEPVWVRFYEEANTHTAPVKASTARRRTGSGRGHRDGSRVVGAARGVVARAGSAMSGLRRLSGRKLQVAVIAGLTVVALLALVVAGLVKVLSPNETAPPMVSAGPHTAGGAGAPAATRSAAAAAAGWCAEEVTADGTVTTSGKGDTASGAGVVAAVEHAYYVARDAALVRSFAGPGSTLPDVAAIQSAIDSVPQGTEFCATVAPTGENTYSLTLRERRPDGQSVTYTNRVQVAEDGGRFSLVSLSAGQ